MENRLIYFKIKNAFKIAKDITNRELTEEVLDKVNDNILKLNDEAIIK